MKSKKITTIQQAFKILQKLYPNAKTELKYKNPFELLIAVILSAQCTDEKVNQVTPHLFQKFPTPQKMAQAPLKELEKIIHPCGFYKTKAKSIKETSQKIIQLFNGQVPKTIDKLTQLSGVGRKTASVVLNQAFSLPAIAVDTHVKRISYRLGWTSHTHPDKIEQDLKKLFPKSQWAAINTTLILHGRRVCKARKPLCSQCPLLSFCPQNGVTQSS